MLTRALLSFPGGRICAELKDVDPGILSCAVGSRRSYSTIKRVADLAVVVLAALPVLLVVAVCALVILVTMGRPIFFVQQRVGLGGRVFRMLKLRTMTASTSAHTSATARNDARITPFGRFCRVSHLDELPQLWNVLVGDMALIGPRPEQPALVERYRAEIPHYDLRHSVRPGLSGWSQVCFGYASDVSETMQKLEYDLFYLRNFGPTIDLRIIVLTALVYSNPKYVR